MQKFDVVSPQYRPLLLSLKSTGVTGVQEVQTLTFPAFASLTDRDYIVVEDTAGDKWAIYADKTGSSIAPTGAIYTAIPAANKSKADVSGDTTAAEVAATFEAAFNALTGFTAVITTDDTAADGTMTLTQVSDGPVTNPVPKSLNDGGAGTLAGVQTTSGVDSGVALTFGQFDATIAETSSGPGDYTITFNEPFVRAPQVAVLPVEELVPRIVSVSTTTLRIECNNLSGTATDSDLHILVVGSQAKDAI